MNRLLCILLISSVLMACNPTVKLETPAEPIRIEANITIKHEIKVVVEKDVEAMFENEDLF